MKWLDRLLGRKQPEPAAKEPWTPGEGWHYWMETRGPSPYAHKWVEAMREGWDGPRVCAVRDMPPEMNVMGLWWRPHSPMVNVTPRPANPPAIAPR